MTTQNANTSVAAINNIVVTGNLGAEPTARTNKNGKSFVTASIATHTVKKNKELGYDSSPDWHSMIFNGSEAKRASSILGKGDYVTIEGRLQYSNRTDAETGFRYKQAFISVVSFKLIAKATTAEVNSEGGAVKADQVVMANCVSA